MDDNTFHELLTRLNKGKGQKLTFSRPLAANVELANHWLVQTDAKTDKSNFFGPSTFYLIKDFTNRSYIGLVEEASVYDLHWYVLPEYRRKGYLSAVLRSVILPHMFQDNREFQCITINSRLLTEQNFNASTALAKTLRFHYTHTKDGIFHYKLDSGIYFSDNYIDGELTLLTDIRAEEIRHDIRYHFKMLEILESELEMKLGKTDNIMGIKEQLDKLRCDFDSIISDAYIDHEISITK